MPIKTELKKITPEWASEVLEKHYKRVIDKKYKQRAISPTVVAKYAADISIGKWRPTPEPIIIDENGDVANGQQRLAAVVRAGKPAMMTVSEGWPADEIDGVGLIDIIDSGKPRNSAAMMAIHGQKYASQHMGALKTVCHVAWCNRKVGLTFPIAMYLLDKINLREGIGRLLGQAKAVSDMSASVIGPLAYYYTVKPRRAVEFATSMFNLEFEEKDSPVKALLNWQKCSATQRRREVFVTSTCAAIRKWDANESAAFIRPTREAIEWLSNLNPKLREQIRQIVPMTHRMSGK